MLNRKRTMLIGLLVLSMMMATGALAEPLSVSAGATASALLPGNEATVTVSVMNIEAERTIILSLLNPSGELCSDFGNQGMAALAPGESIGYSGRWTLTDQDVATGKLYFTLQYGEGETWIGQAQMEIPIEPQEVVATMSIARFVEPGPQVVPGQIVEIRYLMKNTGTVDLSDVTITDPGIAREPYRREMLLMGEEVEAVFEYVADANDRTTHAEIVYSYPVDGELVQSNPMKMDPPITIEAMEP